MIPRSPSALKAERGPSGCLGRSKVVHRTLRHRHARTPWSPWSQNGCTVVGHWSPPKTCLLLWRLCINLRDASVFLVPPLCLLWPTNSVHCAFTVAPIVPPFGDHGNPWATLAIVLWPLCLLCATCCSITADLVVQGRHTGRAAAVTQKQNFWFGRPLSFLTIFWSLKGGTMVASLCKGGFNAYHIYWKNRGIFYIIKSFSDIRNSAIFDIRN